MNETVRYEVSDGVATVTLNRPERLNTMNFDLLEAALETIERAASDEAARVVILTGAGRGFCAGGDLSAGAGGGIASGGAIETDIGRLRRYMRTSELLREMPKPTIAAINGACAGDRKSTRLNSSHGYISYAVFCLKKKKNNSVQ